MLLNKGTVIYVDENKRAARKAAGILTRDIKTVFMDSQIKRPSYIEVIIDEQSGEQAETFTLRAEGEKLYIESSDELGAVYGMLYISSSYLKIDPFWFFMDKPVKQLESVETGEVVYKSRPFYVRYRGWFVNDEVLLLGWNKRKPDLEIWERVFETLLRLGGNMVIPGTGSSSQVLREKADAMGLWITHHHAEPLGAKMFLNAYPDELPSYDQNGPLFDKLWEEAVERQKDSKVIWNIGFRGQGDRAFWEDDPMYDTMEKRGALISRLMRRQYEIISEKVANPVVCTNLYGEILELYKEGYLEFPEGTIKIWADSGYGKMVSRRQGNHNPRVYAMPKLTDEGPHGIYYHVSFYDLQASNHLTMLPNSPAFVRDELTHAFREGADDYLIVNCGNIRPHTYMLDLVHKLWQEGDADVKEQGEAFIKKYFSSAVQEVSECLQEYFKSTIQYGRYLDEKAGEQFYHYLSRTIIHHWISGADKESEKSLKWATGEMPFKEQVIWFGKKCEEGLISWQKLKKKCEKAAEKLEDQERQLFEDWFITQAVLHESGCKGGIALSKSYACFMEKAYEKAFVYAMAARGSFHEGIAAMEKASHDKWTGYYDNDCLTNVKLTVYCLETLAGYIRMIGDAPNFYKWEKEYLYPKEEKGVTLITNINNQLEDEELYERLAEKLNLQGSI